MGTRERSDADLLRDARKDAEAFTRFYRAHAAWVDRWFRGQVRDPQAAADLTAETFAQALLSLPRFRGRDRGTGTAWLFGIARNLLRGYLTRQQVETGARIKLGVPLRQLDLDEYEAVDERLDAAALAAEIQSALGELPPALRETLELRALEGLRYDEIAARTATSEANARMRVARAIRAAGARLSAKDKEMQP